MMTLFEDLRVALLQICRAIGLPRTAATVAPVVVLGVILNVVALSTMEHVRNERHPGHGPTALRNAARTELKVVRTVLVSTLKKMDEGRRRWCLASQWVLGRSSEMQECKVEVGFERAAPSIREDCNVEVVSISHQKMAMGFVQC